MINSQELLFSVDEHNQPITPQPRQLSHDTGIWHRNAHVWIFNTQKEILCQQRSLLKDSNPGLWEPFFGGHLAPGENYLDKAVIEVGEELRLPVEADQLRFFQEYKYVPGTEFQGIFGLEWNGEPGELTLEAEEVNQVVWKSIAEVRRHIIEQQDPQWTQLGSEAAILEWIQKGAPVHSASAGGVVLNAKREVLVVSQRGNSWSLPKGHIEPGETARAAALREITEESGIADLTFVKELGTYERPKIGLNGRDDISEIKSITLFLYTTAQTLLKPIDRDNPEARWVPIAKVVTLLTHPTDKAFFQSIAAKI